MGPIPFNILDNVKGFFKSILEKMMIEERTIFLETANTKANGYYERSYSSVLGEITDFKIPRTRDGAFRSELVPKRKTNSNLDELIAELYAAGISTRDLESVLKKQFGVVLSHSTIARISQVAYEEVEKWKKRALKDYDVIFIDAFYFPLKRDTVEKEAVYVALGIDGNGHREVIGFWIPGGSEGASNWKEIFQGLKERGVNNISYVVADGLTGISDAIHSVYPNALHQYCVLHGCRVSLNKTRAMDKKEVSEDLKMIYFANSQLDAKNALLKFVVKWKRVYPKVTTFWEENFEKLTAFMSLPNQLWRYVYTTNCVERLHKEIKRRIKSMEQFQNELSAEKILYSLYKEQNENYKKSGVNGWKDLYKRTNSVS